ncbi:MAG: indole-3-glycerol phosphate synthase TrpC [bacterium]|nr:indole-3-glycerol phosphate synthase TrpC [bacterium]
MGGKSSSASSEAGGDILERIVASVRERLDAGGVRPGAAPAAAPRRDFLAALSAGGFSVIAEMKRSSPSAGVIRPSYDPAALARAYEAAGAAALSVLTEERFFGGALGHLAEARAAACIPVLRKDFIIDERQVVEAAAAGADALLLIARILEPAALDRLVEACVRLGMTPLVEVFDERDIGNAAATAAPVIGINNRDLRTLSVSIERTLALAPRVPAGRIIVSESGIRSPADIARLREAGVRAALVGESLLRNPDPGAALARLLRGEGK